MTNQSGGGGASGAAGGVLTGTYPSPSFAVPIISGRLSRSTPQTITGQFPTAVIFDAVSANGIQYWTVSNPSRIIIPAAGTYCIDVGLDFSPLGAGIVGGFYSIRENGTTDVRLFTATPLAGEIATQSSLMYIASVSGYLEVNINLNGSSATSTLRVTAGGPQVNIVRVS